jgi:hypothetical protein
MVGLKFKLAHKRTATDKWSASPEARRKDLIRILTALIEDLKREPEQVEPVPLKFDYKGHSYQGNGIPILTSCEKGHCRHFDISLNKEHIGIIRDVNGEWKISELKSKAMARAIGDQILAWYGRR